MWQHPAYHVVWPPALPAVRPVHKTSPLPDGVGIHYSVILDDFADILADNNMVIISIPPARDPAHARRPTAAATTRRASSPARSSAPRTTRGA